MQLGLFPLNLVLFPQSAYPLHIFEEKYKSLISDCIENRSVFAISFTNGDRIAEYGCTASVHSVENYYPDGKMDIIIVGCEKYKLIDFRDSQSLYLTAEVEIVQEQEETINIALLTECIELYNSIIGHIPMFRVPKTTIDDLKDKIASYFLAQKSGLIPRQKQTLLEMNSENARLEYIREHLEKIKPADDKTFEIDKLIRNDGYLPPEKLQ